MNPYDVIKELISALKAASDHLDYCGYGDSWERECAKSSKLPQEIASALQTGQEFLEQ